MFLLGGRSLMWFFSTGIMTSFLAVTPQILLYEKRSSFSLHSLVLWGFPHSLLQSIGWGFQKLILQVLFEPMGQCCCGVSSISTGAKVSAAPILQAGRVPPTWLLHCWERSSGYSLERNPGYVTPSN